MKVPFILHLLSIPWMLALADEECDPNVDYFPDKVFPEFSEFWTVEYFNTYKIVSNLDTNTTYLLYHCGSIPSQDNNTVSLQIPLSSIGITETTAIPFLAQLDETISAYLDDPQYISSSCLRERIQAGDVSVPQLDGGASLPSFDNTTAATDTIIAFTSPFSTLQFFTRVLVSEYRETTNQAIFEWIKFYSTFFNKEQLANQVFLAALTRWDCIVEQAGAVSDDGAKPTVLWAYWSVYCNGWDVGECPNYYCEFGTACQAHVLSSTNGTASATCGATYMTTEELVAFGADADYWFHPGSDWDEAYSKFNASLDTMKSVQNKQVYDYQGSGTSNWFEGRYAEYYDVLQDYCSILEKAKPLDHNAWFRNIFTEEVGSPDVCEDEQAKYPFVHGECTLSEEENDGDDKGGDGVEEDANSSSTTRMVATATTILLLFVTTSLLR
jgi:iron complex transport system substrate-binding protein